jgi:hypothetical protein
MLLDYSLSIVFDLESAVVDVEKNDAAPARYCWCWYGNDLYYCRGATWTESTSGQVIQGQVNLALFDYFSREERFDAD